MIDGSSFFLLLSSYAMTVFASRFDVEATSLPKYVRDRDPQPLSCRFKFRNLVGRKSNRKHFRSSFIFWFRWSTHVRHYRIYRFTLQKDYAPWRKNEECLCGRVGTGTFSKVSSLL